MILFLYQSLGNYLQDDTQYSIQTIIAVLKELKSVFV